MRIAGTVVALVRLGPAVAMAQAVPRGRVLYAPKVTLERTVTFTNLFGVPRVLPDGE